MLETRFVMTTFSGLIAYDRRGASSYEFEERQCRCVALPIGETNSQAMLQTNKSGSTLTENW
jgi:hypothetical protein